MIPGLTPLWTKLALQSASVGLCRAGMLWLFIGRFTGGFKAGISESRSGSRFQQCERNQIETNRTCGTWFARWSFFAKIQPKSNKLNYEKKNRKFAGFDPAGFDVPCQCCLGLSLGSRGLLPGTKKSKSKTDTEQWTDIFGHGRPTPYGIRDFFNRRRQRRFDPPIPQTGKAKRFAAFLHHPERLPFPVAFLPFKKAVGRNDSRNPFTIG